MNKEGQNLLISSARGASLRMTKAWQEMLSSGQVSTYFGMNTKAIDEVKGGIKKGRPPKKGEEHIAEYLRALEDFSASMEKDDQDKERNY